MFLVLFLSLVIACIRESPLGKAQTVKSVLFSVLIVVVEAVVRVLV